LSNAKSGIDGEAGPGFRFTQSGLRVLRFPDAVQREAVHR
jgi:hypothetical protein